MRNLYLALITGLLVAFAHTGYAAPPPPPSATPQQQEPAVEVDESDLQTFATIYVDMQQARAGLQQDMAAAGSQEEAQQIQQDMESQLVSIIEENGWTLEEYNQVTDAINQDAELREQAIQLINEQS